MNKGGIVVRILHHVHQVHDVCIFAPMRLFGEKAAWFHQIHDTEQLNLFYIKIGLTHHEEQTHVLDVHYVKSLQQFLYSNNNSQYSILARGYSVNNCMYSNRCKVL